MAEVEPIRSMKDVRAMYEQLLVSATPREAECFLIGCNLALRASDLLSLRWDQVTGSHVNIVEGKTGKKKQFPITPIVREAMDRLAAFYEITKFKPSHLFQSDCNRNFHEDKPICIQWLSKKIKEASRILELPYNVNTHSMRKTFGYHAYESGADIHYLQALFNHSHSYVTLRYIGVTKTSVQKMYVDHAIDIFK